METSFSFLGWAFGDRDFGGWGLIGLGVVAVILLVFFIVVFNFLSAWVRAYFSGARVGFIELIALRLRNVPVGLIVDNRITAVKAGMDVTIDDLSTHFLAGGNVPQLNGAVVAS